MPLFEYHCARCGETIEVLQRDASVHDRCGDDCARAGEPFAGTGSLVRKMSAHAVLSGGASASEGPSCGSCGGVPGSCQWES